MNIKPLAATVIALCIPVGLVTAQPEGRGQIGKDFYSDTIIIRKNSTVRIVATCYAITVDPGNTTTAQLWINDVKIRDATVESEYSTVTYDVVGNDSYNVLLQCDNYHANAVSAKIDHYAVTQGY